LNERRLAVAPDLGQLWPGAVRHVQSESLKAADLSHWQVSTPRLPVLPTGAAVESRTSEPTP
jgi:hypothetical protein